MECEIANVELFEQTRQFEKEAHHAEETLAVLQTKIEKLKALIELRHSVAEEKEKASRATQTAPQRSSMQRQEEFSKAQGARHSRATYQLSLTKQRTESQLVDKLATLERAKSLAQSARDRLRRTLSSTRESDRAAEFLIDLGTRGRARTGTGRFSKSSSRSPARMEVKTSLAPQLSKLPSLSEQTKRRQKARETYNEISSRKVFIQSKPAALVLPVESVRRSIDSVRKSSAESEEPHQILPERRDPQKSLERKRAILAALKLKKR